MMLVIGCVILGFPAIGFVIHLLELTLLKRSDSDSAQLGRLVFNWLKEESKHEPQNVFLEWPRHGVSSLHISYSGGVL